MNHITLVSVMTEANVPISTGAGGSDAIRMAVAAQGYGNGPMSNINPNTISGWINSFTAMTAGTSQGTRPNGRSATVTPSTNNAVGAAAFCRNNSALSIATGG
jgi:hypothetical protein